MSATPRPRSRPVAAAALLAVLIAPVLPPRLAGAQPGTTPASEVAAAASGGQAVPDAQPANSDSAPPRAAAEDQDAGAVVTLRDYVVLPRVGEYKRTIATRDPIDALIVSGRWKPPAAGDKVTGADGADHVWRKHTADASGAVTIDDAYGGYAFTLVESDADQVMILEAERHASVSVNGEWFSGDPYAAGWVRLPVKLRAGFNELLFHMAGPGFKARLVSPPGFAYFVPEATTLPDVVAGEDSELWAGVTVVNAQDTPLADARLTLRLDDGEPIAAPLPTIPPLSVYKAPVRIPAPRETDAPTHTVRFAVEAPGRQHHTPSVTLPLRRVDAGAAHTRTFVSRIDGGVQPYTIVPAAQPPADGAPPGVILALHGEGVDHAQFADYYTAKPWAHIVAPAGRGKYGFDWEDWGATDAVEALDDAQAHFPHDPTRVYVTGHSMGGHGAWRLGCLHPDRFAAIGPSAGWLSMWSYGGRMPTYEDPTPVQAMLLRAAAGSDTLKMIGNLGPVGVYVLHGDRDAEVPVAQSRFIRSRLGEFHPDFAYLERSGAGNWWGADSCDWPQMMEYFQVRALTDAGDDDRVEFTTPDLDLAAGSRWARIETQDHQGQPSRVDISLLRKSRAFVGTTDNVTRLSLDVTSFEGEEPIRVRLDGGRSFAVKPPASGRVWLSREDERRWAQIALPPKGGKSPARNGTFKSAFDNNALLIYGTGGNAEENAWSLAKARYDAQTFWYRGNGALEVIADKDFDPNRQRNRNVVLYGNADTNLAWPALLSTSPIQVRGGRIIISSQAQDRPEEGAGLAVLFVRPRPRSDTATVGVVAGVDLAGMRLTNRVRYFISGVGLPDLTLLGAESAAEGDGGVRAAGYFGADWSVEHGDITWRDTAL